MRNSEVKVSTVSRVPKSYPTSGRLNYIDLLIETIPPECWDTLAVRSTTEYMIAVALHGN